MIRFEYSPPGICHFFGLDITAVAAIAAVGVAAAGAATTAIAASNQQEFQADVANQNARLQGQAADAAAEDAKRKGERRLALMRSGYIKSGIDASVGSPVDVLAESAGELELDIANIKYAGKIGQLQSELQGQVARKNASDAMTAGYIGVGTSLLTVGSKLYANNSPSASGVPSPSSTGTGYMGLATYGGPR